MKLKIAGAFLILLLPSLILAQKASPAQSYDDLLKQVELHQGTPKVWPYLKVYLKKARQEGNDAEIVHAYKEMMHECEEKYRLQYADSMISAAKISKDRDLIGASYLSKGVVYYQRNMHQQALDNYVSANKYLVATKDDYLKYKVKYSIAQIKYYLGYYHEAISLFRECISYFKEEEPLPYLKSLHCLTTCYTFTGDYVNAIATNKLALEESARLGIKDLLPYIDSAAGIIYYKTTEYRNAINSLSYALPQISEKGDYANKAIAHFYLGSSYWKIGKQDSAVAHFKAVDTIFSEKNYLRPDLRHGYEYLIKYYHQKKLPDEQLKYINQLLKADTILGKEFRYLIKKVYKEHDTAELLAEKEQIQSDLNNSRWSGYIFKGAIAALVLTLLYLFYRHRKLQKIYRQRFEELLKNDIQESADKVSAPKEVVDINPVIVSNILSKLEEFERKKGYLKKDIKATKLAETFSTNYKYLSKVINAHRGKSFVNYINDLRIEYLVARLKEEPLLRKYTNSALASEAGFSTAQHFVTAFKKRTGMPPGYFTLSYEKLSHINDINNIDSAS